MKQKNSLCWRLWPWFWSMSSFRPKSLSKGLLKMSCLFSLTIGPSTRETFFSRQQSLLIFTCFRSSAKIQQPQSTMLWVKGPKIRLKQSFSSMSDPIPSKWRWQNLNNCRWKVLLSQLNLFLSKTITACLTLEVFDWTALFANTLNKFSNKSTKRNLTREDS